jgi:hypothetical protein
MFYIFKGYHNGCLLDDGLLGYIVYNLVGSVLEEHAASIFRVDVCRMRN